MRVTVKAFGISRDIIGESTVQIDLPDNSTVADLKSYLQDTYPEFVKLTSLNIGINESYAADIQEITHNDEVVIIPPVSGG